MLTSFYLGENDEGYEPSKRLDLTGWAAYGISDSISASVRLKYSSSDEINGTDPQISASCD